MNRGFELLWRFHYHLRVMGLNAVGFPLLLAGGFWVILLNAGEGIRNPSAITLWSEVLIPGIAALLCAYAASAASDACRSLVSTAPVPAWRTYLERCGLLLAVYALLSVGLGWLITLSVLPGESWLLSLRVMLVSLPVLLVFGLLSVLAAEFTKSPAAGAATSTGLWLFFLTAKILAYRVPWEMFYPFETFYHGSSPYWAINRLVLTGIGLAAAVALAVRIRRGEKGDN